MPTPLTAPGFITVTEVRSEDPVLINVRHINSVTLRENNRPGSHIGINNSGALGYAVRESMQTVADKITEAAR